MPERQRDKARGGGTGFRVSADVFDPYLALVESGVIPGVDQFFDTPPTVPVPRSLSRFAPAAAPADIGQRVAQATPRASDGAAAPDGGLEALTAESLGLPPLPELPSATIDPAYRQALERLVTARSSAANDAAQAQRDTIEQSALGLLMQVAPAAFQAASGIAVQQPNNAGPLVQRQILDLGNLERRAAETNALGRAETDVQIAQANSQAAATRRAAEGQRYGLEFQRVQALRQANDTQAQRELAKVEGNYLLRVQNQYGQDGLQAYRLGPVLFDIFEAAEAKKPGSGTEAIRKYQERQSRRGSERTTTPPKPVLPSGVVRGYANTYRDLVERAERLTKEIGGPRVEEIGGRFYVVSADAEIEDGELTSGQFLTEPQRTRDAAVVEMSYLDRGQLPERLASQLRDTQSGLDEMREKVLAYMAAGRITEDDATENFPELFGVDPDDAGLNDFDDAGGDAAPNPVGLSF